MLRGISTGERDWLTIANRLHPVSDAGAAEQLELAVGEALEHRPANVLRISVPVFGLGVCGGPDVDDPRYDSYELSMRAIDKRKAAVRGVRDADLRPARDGCTSELDSARTGIAKSYGRSEE